MKKSLISAIKKLLAKLGAEEIEDNNLVEVIDSGADAIEGGGSGGAFFVTDNNNTLDKTWAEIYAASTSNIVVLRIGPTLWYMNVILHDGENYGVNFFSYVTKGRESGASEHIYFTQSETGYPVLG